MSRKFVALSIVVFLHACGGAGASSEMPTLAKASELKFDVDYSLSQSPIFPAGTIQVSPAPGEMTIGSDQVAKVELLLFGYDKQTLELPNFQPKDNPQLRYVFKLPETFIAGFYPCGTGNYLSEVRVTDVTGFSLAKTFEICPGTPFHTSAAGP